MKAIIFVPANSYYARLNGLTFEVKELLSTLIVLDLYGVPTDFTAKEVFIVDLSAEVLKAYQLKDEEQLAKLKRYASIRGFKY